MTLAHNIPVLMYHHVNPGGGSLTVSANRFASQIRGLAARGYQSLRSEHFADFLAGRPLPRKSVLITFDDGYLDNWVYAHPVLKRYGFSAMLFTVTGLIGDGPVRPVWGQTDNLPACPDHHKAKRLMFGSKPDRVMLRWSEVEQMVADGSFEIHSHTHTHTRWDTVSKTHDEKYERVATDLNDSLETLQRRLGVRSSHLCWPQGYFDDDYLRAAHKLGFQHLYTTDARGQNTPHGDPGYIYRFAVRNRPSEWLQRRLWLASHPVWGPVYNRWKGRSDARKKADKHVSTRSIGGRSHP